MSSYSVFPLSQRVKLEEIDSTNNYVEKLLESNTLPEGLIIYTDNQTSGRGQGTNKWESEPYKNLTATLVLNPTSIEAQHQFYLTIVLSLSVCDVIDHLLKSPISQVKWPNDVYCNNRKIAGILIKNYVMGNSLSTSIAGLGLNINQTKFLTVPFATSLKILSGKDYVIDEVMTLWHDRVASRYDSLKTSKKELLDEYLSKLYLMNKMVDYTIHDKKVTAAITGVDAHGQIQLRDHENKLYTCGLKEIIFPFIK